MQLNDISCDVCRDLMPLVKDEVASNDSCNLVTHHIEQCDACRSLYYGQYQINTNQIDDTKNIRKIKRHLYFFGFVILIFGTLLGLNISNSMNMFYNFIIMPMVGAIGYAILRKKWYYIPTGIFLISYLWLFTGYVIEYREITQELFTYPLLLSPIYSFLSSIGILITALFYFTFKKEVNTDAS